MNPAFVQPAALSSRSAAARSALCHRHIPRLPCPSSRPSSSRAPRMTATNPATRDTSSSTAAVALDRVVCKFGGSSLADAERLCEVTKLVKLQAGLSARAPIIVLSAMGPSTNELLRAGERALVDGVVDISSVRERAYAACDALGLSRDDIVDGLLRNLDELLIGVKFIRELSPRTQDYLVSFGERLSVRIFAEHLRVNEGLKTKHVDAFDLGFVSDSRFCNAELDEDATFANIRAYFANDAHDDKAEIVIVTGFIAKDTAGNITTLGRGGSDLTACILGAALDTTEVQVWKDVDGILSTDPRICSNAIPIPTLSFEEAAEMAFFGAKVLHPNAMQPAMKYNIPVRVKNSYNPSHPGTVIVKSRQLDGVENPVTAISLKKNVQVVDIVSTRMLGASGFLVEVFKAFSSHNISIDMIATSEVSISMTLDNAVCDEQTLHNVKNDIAEYASVSFSQNDKAIVSLVSDSQRSSDVVGKACSALNDHGIHVIMISQGASKYNVSVTVEMDDATNAIKAMHDAFF